MRKTIYMFGYCFCIIAMGLFLYKLLPILRPLIYIEVPYQNEPGHFSIEPRANLIGFLFSVLYLAISTLVYKRKFKDWVIEKPLKPFTEGVLLSLIINCMVVFAFLFSIEWDLDNLSIDKFNSLILIIGIWQWIYIIPINIYLSKRYKKRIAAGVNTFSGVLTVVNIIFIVWIIVYLSIHGVGGMF